jgi:glyoxylase-like metal-dependent hydrolase (beta-lactamase superfamily II)
MRLMGRDDLLQEREVVLRRIIGRSAGVDRELTDGDVVDLGQDVHLRVVHTPGHTAGSVCFFWEAGGMVFTGDAVQGHGWRAGMPPIYHDVTYLDSLQRIEDLGASVLCMGHTFGWDGVLNHPVRQGPEVVQTLQSSRNAFAVFQAAAAHALAECGPNAPFPRLAEVAFREVVCELPVRFDRRTTVPIVAARAISAHLFALGWRPAAQPAGAPE